MLDVRRRQHSATANVSFALSHLFVTFGSGVSQPLGMRGGRIVTVYLTTDDAFLWSPAGT